MVYPVTQFCCGCSVAFGTGTILLFHLAACIFFIVCTCSNVIGMHPTLFSDYSGPWQLAVCGYFLIGLPLILCGAYGLYYRIEINIRIYLAYLLLSFVVDAAYLITFLARDVCEHAFLGMINKQDFGEAALCGTARTVSTAAVAVALVIEVYCLWVVWSMVEDVHSGKNGPELAELIPGKGTDPVFIKNKALEEGPYGGIVGFSKSKLPGPYPSPYGAISNQGNTIFGGSIHDTDYPPSQI